MRDSGALNRAWVMQDGRASSLRREVAGEERRDKLDPSAFLGPDVHGTPPSNAQFLIGQANGNVGGDRSRDRLCCLGKCVVHDRFFHPS